MNSRAHATRGRGPVAAIAAPATVALLALALLAGCDNNGLGGRSIVLDSAVITSPLEGFNVLGSVTVRANVTGREAPVSVDLYVDGAKLASDAATPWEFSWNTASLAAESEHRLEVVAVDADGRTLPSATITVTVIDGTFSGDYGLFVINADGTNLREILPLEVFPISPDVSPAGSRIAFIGITADVDGDGLILPGGDDIRSEYYLVNADGTGLVRKTTNDFIEEDVRWSADGVAVLFASNRGGGADLEIYSQQVTGGIIQNKTATPGESERCPVEAGDLIYHSRFAAGSDPGTGSVYTVHRTSRVFAEVTTPGFSAVAPSWLAIGDLAPDLSPDGFDLAFSRSQGSGAADASALGNVDLVVRHLADGIETDLSQNARAELFPRWSPDGSRILIVSWDDAATNGGGLVLVNPADGSHTEIGPLPAHLRPIQAAWFPGAALDSADATPDIVFAAAHVSRLE